MKDSDFQEDSCSKKDETIAQMKKLEKVKSAEFVKGEGGGDLVIQLK